MFEKLIAAAEAHPLLMAALIWPFVTAILTVLFKPRSAEEYAELAKNWPRLAAFWRFLGAIGLDIPKAVQSLQEFIKPRGPMLVFAMLGLVLTTTSCTPGQRAVARTVLGIIETTCIIAHQDLPDEEVAKVCGLAGPFIEPMKDVLAESRRVTAREAAFAAARQLELDTQREKAGCGGYRDGGLR